MDWIPEQLPHRQVDTVHGMRAKFRGPHRSTTSSCSNHGWLVFPTRKCACFEDADGSDQSDRARSRTPRPPPTLGCFDDDGESPSPWVEKEIRSLMMMVMVEKCGFRLRGNLVKIQDCRRLESMVWAKRRERERALFIL